MRRSEVQVSRAFGGNPRSTPPFENLGLDHHTGTAGIEGHSTQIERPSSQPAIDRARAEPVAHASGASKAETWGLARAAICVVVPAFNEERSIARVVLRVQQAVPAAHIVVVNDGSGDNTALYAHEAGATVVTLPVNLGIGGAVQVGYQYALRNGFKIAIQVDGDDQHDPSEIERLLDLISQDDADMTVGSRWLGRGDYLAPVSRRIGMRLLAKLVRWRVGGSFTDTTSGFRAVNRRGIELFAKLYPTDFPEVESLVLAKRHGLRLREVPVQMSPRSHGQSSIGGVRSVYYMVRVTVALLLGGLNPPETKEAL